MKKLVTIILLFFFQCGFSQTKNPFLESLGIGSSLDHVTFNKFGTATDPEYGLTSGFFLKKKLKKRFTLVSGLVYSNRSYEIKNISPWSGSVSDSGIDNITDTLYDKKVTFNNIELPLTLNWNFLSKEKFKLYALAGFSFNYHLNHLRRWRVLSPERVEYYSFKKLYPYTSDGQRLEVGTLIGIGFDYKLNPKWSLSAQILYRFYDYDKQSNSLTVSRGFNISLNYLFQ